MDSRMNHGICNMAAYAGKRTDRDERSIDVRTSPLARIRRG